MNSRLKPHRNANVSLGSVSPSASIVSAAVSEQDHNSLYGLREAQE